MENKNNKIIIRFSESELFRLNQAVADMTKLTGKLYNRSDLIRMALEFLYQEIMLKEDK